MLAGANYNISLGVRGLLSRAVCTSGILLSPISESVDAPRFRAWGFLFPWVGVVLQAGGILLAGLLGEVAL